MKVGKLIECYHVKFGSQRATLKLKPDVKYVKYPPSVHAKAMGNTWNCTWLVHIYATINIHRVYLTE